MPTILSSRSIYYNDVNSIAEPSVINSRSEVPKELNRVMVAPMESVVGEDFAIKANELGLTVCLHRFCKIEDEVNLFKKLPKKDNVFVGVGLDDWNRTNMLANNGARNFLIDIANGYIPNITNAVERIVAGYPTLKIMVGNVMNKEGIALYKNFGKLLDGEFYIRVGIAGGCFVPNSVVKMETGNKTIKDIKIGDCVLTHTGEFCAVINKFEYDRDEELISINNITCTKNHEFYVVPKKCTDTVNDNNIHQYAEWIKAENLTNEYFLVEM